MSYESRLDGILTLHPTPSATTEEALHTALQGVGDPRAGWLVLSKGALTSKDATDWKAARAQLKQVLKARLLPLGLEARGTLLALGEDDRLLARLTVDGAAMEVRLEPSSDDDAERSGWLASLRGKNTEQRKAAVQHLGAWSDAEVLKALSRAAASDWEVSVRIAALETLGGLGEAAVTELPTCVACLGDREPFVRYWATHAVGRMGAAAKDALPALEALSSDREDGPRYGGADAIRRIRTALSRDAFKLVVTHVESIQGRGTVVRGVMQGRLAVMDDVAVVHGKRFIMTRVGTIFSSSAPSHHLGGRDDRRRSHVDHPQCERRRSLRGLLGGAAGCSAGGWQERPVADVKRACQRALSLNEKALPTMSARSCCVAVCATMLPSGSSSNSTPSPKR